MLAQALLDSYVNDVPSTGGRLDAAFPRSEGELSSSDEELPDLSAVVDSGWVAVGSSLVVSAILTLFLLCRQFWVVFWAWGGGWQGSGCIPPLRCCLLHLHLTQRTMCLLLEDLVLIYNTS